MSFSDASGQSSRDGRFANGGRKAWALGVTPLLWIVQAALLALAVEQLASGAGFNVVIPAAIGFLLLGTARATVESWAERRLFQSAQQHLSAMRADAIAALANRSPLDRRKPLSGAAASTLAEQAEAVLPWLTRYSAAQWRVLVVPPMIALAVGYYSWVAALILAVSAPVIPLFMAIIGWRAKAASEAQLRVLSDMNGFLLDRLRGMSTLRALGAVDVTANRVRDTAEDLRMRTMRVLRIAFLSSTALELFASLGVALVAVYVGFHLLGQFNFGSWGQPLSLGEALFILLLASAFFEPLRELSAVWHDKVDGQAAYQALKRLGSQGLALPGSSHAHGGGTMGPEAVRESPPSVLVKGLTFSHPDGSPVFHDFNLRVRAGEHVALVGDSGVGKSTLLAILAGLAPIDAGKVFIGNILLNDEAVNALRTRMAWIGQRIHVFPGTVQTNVAMGRAGIDSNRVESVIRQVGLDPEGSAALHERLGEGGIGLSGGEQVRLALARAAASGADFWLVDEPTAHLDRQTARETIDALVRLAEGRTLIVATHDPELARRLDRIVTLHGRVSSSHGRQHVQGEVAA